MFLRSPASTFGDHAFEGKDHSGVLNFQVKPFSIDYVDNNCKIHGLYIIIISCFLKKLFLKMEIIIPEFYIFMAGIIILILMIFICFYYFWFRRTKIQQTPITNIQQPIDHKEARPAWLRVMIDNKFHFLYEDARGFHLTTDPNLGTKYRYHSRDSVLLKNLGIQIPTLAKKTVAFESLDSILEIRYLDATKVQAILRYQKHTGYIIKYFHIINGNLILDDNSSNQVLFEIPQYISLR
jgi:hypothetical protein